MSVAVKDRAIVSTSKNRYHHAPRNPDYTIDQAWSSYSSAEHDRWDRLFKRSRAILHDRACDEFLAMMDKLKLSESGIPNMDRLSDRLGKLPHRRGVPVAQPLSHDVFVNHPADRL